MVWGSVSIGVGLLAVPVGVLYSSRPGAEVAGRGARCFLTEVGNFHVHTGNRRQLGREPTRRQPATSHWPLPLTSNGGRTLT
jgi:hypothetical protein